jgi:hypothetical protein
VIPAETSIDEYESRYIGSVVQTEILGALSLNEGSDTRSSNTDTTGNFSHLSAGFPLSVLPSDAPNTILHFYCILTRCRASLSGELKHRKKRFVCREYSLDYGSVDDSYGAKEGGSE